MLRNGKLDVIEDLEEQFNENIYLIPIESAQEKLIQHGKKNRIDELLEVGQGSHVLLDIAFLKDETLNHYKEQYYRIQGQTNNVLKECGEIEIKIWNALNITLFW
jgi:hypothetical protein